MLRPFLFQVMMYDRRIWIVLARFVKTVLREILAGACKLNILRLDIEYFLPITPKHGRANASGSGIIGQNFGGNIDTVFARRANFFQEQRDIFHRIMRQMANMYLSACGFGHGQHFVQA